jgi:hypothetical protein
MTGLAVAHAWVRWRASAVLWAAHASRVRARLRARLVPHTALLLVILGLGGGLAGGALIGEWCLGLMLIAESALVVYVGLARDDGTGRPQQGHTVPEILERARNLP